MTSPHVDGFWPDAERPRRWFKGPDVKKEE